MNIFFGTTEIAGWHLNLYKGCLDLGHDCVYGCGFSSMPSYSGLSDLPEQPWVIRVFQKFELIAARTPKSKIFQKIYHRLIDRAWRLIVLLYVARNFDAVVYGFGSFIFIRREMLLLKVMGIKILHVFHGSDSRHPAIDGSYFSNERRVDPQVAIQWSRKMRKKMQLIEKYSDYVAMSPTTAHFLTKPFLNWHLALGMPFAGKTHFTRKNINSRIRIVHCPSLMAAKGTAEITQCIDNLRDKGYDIDFILIHGKPHHEVIEALSSADIAVDQFYSDLVFSGFGVEAAFYGVLPVTCGYAEFWRNVCKSINMPTHHYYHPNELELKLEFLINNPEIREEWTTECQNFITNEWSNRSIARRLIAIFEGKADQTWYCDPMTTIYCHGFGLSKDRAKEGVRLFLEYGGVDSLCLDHNPALRQAFVEFAN